MSIVRKEAGIRDDVVFRFHVGRGGMVNDHAITDEFDSHVFGAIHGRRSLLSVPLWPQGLHCRR
jgi:hypothetical protein